MDVCCARTCEEADEPAANTLEPKVHFLSSPTPGERSNDTDMRYTKDRRVKLEGAWLRGNDAGRVALCVSKNRRTNGLQEG